MVICTAALSKGLVTECALESALQVTGDDDCKAMYPNFSLATELLEVSQVQGETR
jgi:hypothetical protein